MDPRTKQIAGGGVDPDALTGTQRVDGSPKGGHRLRVESFVIQDHTPIRDFISVDAVGIALLKTRNHLGVRVQYTGCGVALKRVDTKPTMFSCAFGTENGLDGEHCLVSRRANFAWIMPRSSHV